jgi:N-acetylneuraminate synthase/N,N'-diacetyllegionaminate synthase
MKLSKKVKIGNKWVGDGYPCFIIAEAGANHDRKLSQAKKLIDIAKEAGADAVKFQIYSAETLYSQEVKTLPGENKKPFNVIKKTEMPREWIPNLANYAKKQGLIFLSSPFDRDAIEQLNPFVPAFKWASPELIDRPLLEYAAKKGKPLIISTGFYGLKEISEALKWVYRVENNKIILLHCTGLYPTFPEEVNLKVIPALKKKFHIPIGLSDHTLDTVTPAAAVVLGANVIEKHFTLSRQLKGPDHPFALEPKELKEMVNNIRNIERSLGSGRKKPVEREIKKEKLIRRGIVATKDLKRGEKITPDNITIKRVGEGAILPKDLPMTLGKKLLYNVETDQKITWKIIKK